MSLIDKSLTFFINAALRIRHRLARGGSPAPRNSAESLRLQQEWELNDQQMDKIHVLAALRGEELAAAYRHTVANLIGSVPSRIVERNVLRGLDFKSIELEDNLTRLVLSNGRVFYGHPSRVKHINLFYVFSDLVPKGFTPETYVAGVDAITRYQKGGEYNFFPGEGGVVIEGGAYVGYKAVRFAEIVGPTGKVIAIEIGRRNYEIMCKNIHANGMEDIIKPIHCGIWKEQGEMTADFEYANAYHLAVPDEHDFCSRRETVPTQTLDNIIDAHELETVDFLNLQLNGAEYEGLQGLQRRFNDVKIIRVAAYYTRDGERQSDAIVRQLQQRGCKILAISRRRSVIAATERFAHEYAALSNAPSMVNA